MLRKTMTFLVAFMLCTTPLVGPAAAADDIGVVLLHGKWGTAKPKSPIGKLAARLKRAGFAVQLPSVAWSKSRYLDRDYEAAMADIDQAVKTLKAAGKTKIVVGGQSMGANAALGYGARHDGLAGVMAIAPGHIPEVRGYQDRLDHDYKRALAAVGAGNGDQVDGYKDLNQGKAKNVRVKAHIYASWFDIDGPASMPKNAAALKSGTPLLWMVGTRDSMLERGEDYAFSGAPPHANNAYVVIDGASHGNTPIKGADAVIDWLNGL